jgi:uncharacterized BrkB/YihY/UPF0761 family membrane protein
LKRTAQEWSQDKCPQLGAALAYYTVFSLAPLVLVLLAVFGLIYGGNEQAREKILDQLSYLIDPSGLKVIQDIAEHFEQAKEHSVEFRVILAGTLRDRRSIPALPEDRGMQFVRTRSTRHSGLCLCRKTFSRM